MQYKDIILSLQRGIISGLILETFNPDEVKERVKIFNEIIPDYKDFFTKEQLLILRFAYHDYKKYNKDGFICFGLSDVSVKVLINKYSYVEEELSECLSASPLIVETIEEYLKTLRDYVIKQRLGIIY